MEKAGEPQKTPPQLYHVYNYVYGMQVFYLTYRRREIQGCEKEDMVGRPTQKVQRKK